MDEITKSSKKGPVNFEDLLKTAVRLPLVYINREDFLRQNLKNHCDEEALELAIKYNPAYAGIPLDVISKVADASVRFESAKVTGMSVLAGIPGGLAMLGTVPADLLQYYGHVLRIMQKLVYLYGWEELIPEQGEMNDEVQSMLTIFTGLMFGVDGVAKVVTRLSESAAEHAGKVIARKALTKGVIYPIVKKIATTLGVKMTKEVFAKGVSKIIPLIGGAISGGMTLATFMPMAFKFKDFLAKQDIANPDKVNRNVDDTNAENSDPVEIDFSDVTIEDTEEENTDNK